MIKFNIPEIDNIISNIYVATKFKCVLFDSNFNVIHSHPDTMGEFCRLVRKVPEYAEKCKKCDNYGLKCSTNSLKTHIYKCHMGLTEAVSPIIYSNSVIGFIMIGQLLTEDCKETIEKNIKAYPDKELIPKLLDEYAKLTVSKYENIHAVINIIEMCASYLWLKQLISFNVSTVSYAIRDYISEHLNDDLTVPVLCRTFNTSKSTLYALSVKEFGKGISEYIRDVRMNKAKQLLSGTDFTISEIAEKVGFIDTNYFIKVFKNYTGTTPLRWKRNLTN